MEEVLFLQMGIVKRDPGRQEGIACGQRCFVRPPRFEILPRHSEIFLFNQGEKDPRATLSFFHSLFGALTPLTGDQCFCCVLPILVLFWLVDHNKKLQRWSVAPHNCSRQKKTKIYQCLQWQRSLPVCVCCCHRRCRSRLANCVLFVGN